MQCRAGFEPDCAQELQTRVVQGRGQCICQAEVGSGYVLADAKAPRDFYGTLHWKEWIFARQWWLVAARVDLSAADRITPLVEAAQYALPEQMVYSELVCEFPDTNDGRQVTPWLNRFEPLLEKALQDKGLLNMDGEGPSLRCFFLNQHDALIGLGTERSAPWACGFPRLRFPAEAPSRSTLKLAEAFEVFLSPREQELALRAGMHAVDLGAAPGGWTWQLVARGLQVVAVDNGPMKGGVLGHPSVKHLRTDGFRFRPERPVEWLVCDMVEQPRRVAELMRDWVREGFARQAIFNLKLPMKIRLDEVRACLQIIETGALENGLRVKLWARQLYHDREEVTVYMRVEGKAKKNIW